MLFKRLYKWISNLSIDWKHNILKVLLNQKKIYIVKARKTDINNILIRVYTSMAHTNCITLGKHNLVFSF